MRNSNFALVRPSESATFTTPQLQKSISNLHPTDPIPTEEEIALGRTIQKGGKEGNDARWTLLRSNILLIISLAKKMCNNDDLQSDYLDEALVAAWECTATYDPEVGVRFLSYAMPIVRNALTEYLRDTEAKVRHPKNLHDLARKYMRVNANAEVPQTAQQFAEAESISYDQALKTITLATNFAIFSGDEKIDSEDSDSVSFFDNYGEESVAPCADYDKKVALDAWNNYLSKTLNKTELFVWKNCSSVFGGLGKSHFEVGLLIGRTSEAVRKLYAKANNKVIANMPDTLRQLMKESYAPAA